MSKGGGRIIDGGGINQGRVARVEGQRVWVDAQISGTPIEVKIVEDKIPLSSSSNGRPIKIGATATPGNTVHLSVAGFRDIVTFTVTNTDRSADHELTIEWGGTTNPDDHIIIFCPAAETVIAVHEKPIQAGLQVRAFADQADTLILQGSYRREAI